MAELSDDPPHKRVETIDNSVGFNVLREIEEALRGLRFGHITVVVHEGSVVQIERLEKRRVRSARV